MLVNAFRIAASFAEEYIWVLITISLSVTMAVVDPAELDSQQKRTHSEHNT